MQLNNKLYYYEIVNAREQDLVGVHINVNIDLTDIIEEKGGKNIVQVQIEQI